MYAEIVTFHQVFEKVCTLTYTIPSSLKNITLGCFVEIPFGSSITRGVVVRLSETTDVSGVKEILSVVDTNIIIPESIIQICFQIAEYYHVALYRIFQLFIPQDILLGRYISSKEYFVEKGKHWETRLTLISSRAKKQKGILPILELHIGSCLSTLGLSRTVLKPFIQKDIIQIIEKESLKNPSDVHMKKGKKSFKLNSEQNQVFETILSHKEKPHLLYGITGSGKTEIYIRCIQKFLEKDSSSQVIVLVPEINLTPQLVSRFKDYFEDISLWHSRLSPQEKLDEWMKIYMGRSRVIIGSRSALFTPVRNLSAVIVDEEHDSSYKQDKTPRYEVHSVLHIMKSIRDIYVVFGSATPKVESLFKANKGEYILSTLSGRYTEYELPEVHVVDMTQERLEPRSFLSYPLQLAIRSTLDRKEQVILFLNRRGFASLTCKNCGWHHECDACDISSTMHVFQNRAYLRCHCCGKNFKLLITCPDCGSSSLFPLGAGTQKIEEELMIRFPDARILRIDQDTTRGKHAHREHYEKMNAGNADIIIGTQMVAKGLDIKNVTLVGIILADYGLHIPDFRAEEYTYQLLSQVAGRAGRHKPGKVILQTFSPDNDVISAVKNHTFTELYECTLSEREKFFYPPYSELVKLEFKDVSLDRCKSESQKLSDILKKAYDGRKDIVVLGPTPALVVKRYNKYHYHIIIKHTLSQKDLFYLFSLIPKNWIIDRNPYFVI